MLHTTPKLRWLRIPPSEMNGKHPSALYIPGQHGPLCAMVLQQLWEDKEGNWEWRDIQIYLEE